MTTATKLSDGIARIASANDRIETPPRVMSEVLSELARQAAKLEAQRDALLAAASQLLKVKWPSRSVDDEGAMCDARLDLYNAIALCKGTP